MQEISGINHIGLRVSDLAQTRSYYEKLGFQFIIGPVGPEPIAIMEHPAGININFILNGVPRANNILMDVPDKHPGYTHFAIEVTDLNALAERLKEKNIPIKDGPVTIPGGAQFLFVRDPDGNVIEFHQPAKA